MKSYENHIYNELSHEDLATETISLGFGEGIALSSDKLSTIKEILFPNEALIEENLKKEIEKLKNERLKDSQTLMIRCQERDDAVNEVNRLKAQIFNLTNYNPSTTNHFNYFLDNRLFPGSDDLWVQKLCDCLYHLTEETDNNGEYLIKNASYVAAIYHVLCKSTDIKHKMSSERGKKADFVFFWNKNIPPRINNTNRKEQLTLKKESFAALFNKHPWNSSNPQAWKSSSTIASNCNNTYWAMNKIKTIIEREMMR